MPYPMVVAYDVLGLDDVLANPNLFLDHHRPLLGDDLLSGHRQVDKPVRLSALPSSRPFRRLSHTGRTACRSSRLRHRMRELLRCRCGADTACTYTPCPLARYPLSRGC